MNIFVLDENPKLAASYMCDKHIPKMILECAQMLVAVAHRWGISPEDMPLTKSGTPYKVTHQNHPCTLWAGDSIDNWLWLCEHAFGLIAEYNMRYDKRHACDTVIHQIVEMSKWVLPEDRDMTPFALAMPDEFRPNHLPRIGPTFQDYGQGKGKMMYRSEVKGDSHASGDDAVKAYRAYYHSKTFAKWEKGTPAPDWWQGIEVIA